MTGSVVISNHPVYVTCGAVQSSVGVFNFTSNLVSYVPPTERNGNNYVLAAAEGRTTSTIFGFVGRKNKQAKLLAIENFRYARAVYNFEIRPINNDAVFTVN